MSRVTVIFDRFGPYHVARLGAAAASCDLTGIEVYGRSLDYAWDPVDSSNVFERVTLFPAQHASGVSGSSLQRTLGDALARQAPDAVAVPGWAHPAAMAGIAWCAANRVPCVVLSESTAWDAPRRPFREWIKRRLVRLCNAGLAGGEAHRDYLASLGMSRASVFLGYDAVDNQHFATGAARARADANDVRRQLDLPDRYFLASARFVAKKNLPRLLEAYARYRSVPAAARFGDAWDLVLLGDGELKDDLLALRAALGLERHVHLPGFIQYSALPAYYGLAGAFVHASSVEQWGLVVNEAMASGLPVLVSSACGCAGDLVVSGENGYTFEPQDVATLAQLLATTAAAPPVLRSAMGARSLEIISSWGIARFASGLSSAVAEALSRPVPAPTPLDHVLLRAMARR